MVKNEADIIESFVRHNLKRLDALAIIDDGSSDGTKEILFALEGEGLNIVVLERDGNAFEQSQNLSNLFAVCSDRIDYDWIFPLDADEAIDCENRTSLETALKQIGKGRIGRIPWRTYIPTVNDDWAQNNPLWRMVNRRETERPQFYKIAIPRLQKALVPLVIASGSHSVRKATLSPQLPMTTLEDVSLAHFPVRSPAQLVRKVVCGWLSLCAEGSGRPSRGFHWRDMYSQFVRDGIPNAQEIERLARCYSGQTDDGSTVCSSLRIADTTPLRYGNDADQPIFVSIARTAEELIKRHYGTSEARQVNSSFQSKLWPHGSRLYRGRLNVELALRAYLKRRFSGGAYFVEDKKDDALVRLLDRGSAALAKDPIAIVLNLVADHRKGSASACWEEKGWAVDHTATFAVRLLGWSACMRRYAIVLVASEHYLSAQSTDCRIPPPGAPVLWEFLRRQILRGHFLGIKLFWRFKSTAMSIKSLFHEYSSRRRNRRNIHVSDMS